MLRFSALVPLLLSHFIVQTLGGESFGKEPQPKIPHMPKKEEKQETKKEGKHTYWVCYPGYSLVKEKQCIKEIVEEPLSLGNRVVVPYLHQCPPGFEAKKKGVCTSTIEVPPEFYCPAGWTDNITDCITSEPPQFGFECPKGKKWELVDGKCIMVHRAKPIVNSKCPDGSHVEKDGHCWRTIASYDCTPEREKKKDDKKKEGRKKERVRRLGEKDDKEDDKKKNGGKKHEKKVELLQELEQVTPPTTTRVGVTTQMCEKSVQVDPIVIISCPDGFAEGVDQECWKEELTEPIRVCLSNKKKDDGNCRPIERVTPKVVKCPAGSEREKEKCVQRSSVPPLNICPVGWNDDGNGCLGVLEGIPPMECHPGLRLVGDKCVGELVRPAISVALQTPACEGSKY